MFDDLNLPEIIKDIIKYEPLKSKDDNEGKIQTEIFLKYPIVCFYWAAGWCKVSQNFGPKLLEFYEQVNKTTKQFEIIHFSFDKDENEYEKARLNSPWFCFPLKSERGDRLRELLEIHFIPVVTVFKCDNKTLKEISRDGRMEIQEGKINAFDKWLIKGGFKQAVEKAAQVEDKKDEKKEEKNPQIIEQKKENN